jgi:hypothetical protein
MVRRSRPRASFACSCACSDCALRRRRDCRRAAGAATRLSPRRAPASSTAQQSGVWRHGSSRTSRGARRGRRTHSADAATAAVSKRDARRRARAPAALATLASAAASSAALSDASHAASPRQRRSARVGALLRRRARRRAPPRFRRHRAAASPLSDAVAAGRRSARIDARRRAPTAALSCSLSALLSRSSVSTIDLDLW